MNPRVTLVMPVYNGEQYVASAIASAVGQDYDNFEIIIVNDGSTDLYSDRIARAFRDANPARIRYISQKNGGVSAALNAAIAVATGEFFCWLSHDDLFYSDRIRSQVEFHAQIGIKDASVFSNFSLIDSTGKSIHGPALAPKIFETNPEISLLHSGINGCTLLIPMELMRRYGPFDTALRSTQDYDLWGRILTNHPFFYNDNELVRYRVHPEQGTQNPASAREGDTLWIKLMEDQDPIRRVQMFGSKRRFYEAIGEFLAKSSPYVGATAHARKMMRVDNTELLVTVLLIVGDDEAAARRSLTSVLEQAHQNWELKLLTPTWTPCAEAISHDSMDWKRIQWIIGERDEAGLLNKGIDSGRGDYIAFIRSGDVWFNNRLSKQLELVVEEGRLVSHGSYLDWWKDLSTKRVAVIQSEQSVTADKRELSPIDIAFSTLLVHRAVTAAGLRFESGSAYATYLFITSVANLHDWIGVGEPVAEIVINMSSPKIDLLQREAIEAACRLHVSPSERLFCSLQLESSPVSAGAARRAFIESFADGIVVPSLDVANPVDSGTAVPAFQLPETEALVVAPQGYVLLLAHDWGGGTQRFLTEKIRALHSDGFGVYLLRRVTEVGQASNSPSLATTIYLKHQAMKGGEALLEVLDSRGDVSRTIVLDVRSDSLAEELSALQIRRVEIHSLVTLKPALWVPLIRSLALARIPYSVYLHDYMLVCPRLFMVWPNGDYCGAPDIDGCERCIAQHGGIGGKTTVSSWRALHGSMLSEAACVVAPDEDVRKRFHSYFPGLSIHVRPHSSEQDQIRRVLVLGHNQVHKGSDTLVRTARVAFERNRPIEFLLLGTSDREDELKALSNVQLLGPYREGSLVGRINELKADLVWFPGQAVETFSYTLSATFEAGVCPVAFDVGAIASRIRASGRGKLLPLWMAKNAESLLDQLLKVDVESPSEEDDPFRVTNIV